MGKIFEHTDEFGGGIVAFTPDTPDSRFLDEIHMEQRGFEDWEHDNRILGDFSELKWEAHGQLVRTKVDDGNQLLYKLAQFQGGELRCFVCQAPMPSAGDNVRLRNCIKDQLESVGVNNLRFPKHGLVGLIDQTHYGHHGLIDKHNYNGINPTLEMVKVSQCDPHLEGLSWGDVIAPALDSFEQCSALIPGSAKRCGVRVALPAWEMYCPIHMTR